MDGANMTIDALRGELVIDVNVGGAEATFIFSPEQAKMVAAHVQRQAARAAQQEQDLIALTRILQRRRYEPWPN